MTNISIKNLTFNYDNQLVPLFDNATVEIDSSWKTGLVGRNGDGKTTLMNLLCGKLSSYKGNIVTALSFSYFPLSLKTPNELTFYTLQSQVQIEEWRLKKELASLCKNPSNLLWSPFNQLSGGEQTKVLLACAFAQKDYFPLLDEPTNHLDHKTRAQVANYLHHKKSGFILTSHDRIFLNHVIDHVVAIEQKKLIVSHGNYDTYSRNKQLKANFEQAQNQKLKNEISRLQNTTTIKSNWANQIEQRKIHSPHAKVSSEERNISTGAIGKASAKMMKRAKTIEKRITQKIDAKSTALAEVDSIDEITLNYHPLNVNHLLVVEELRIKYPHMNHALFDSLSFDLHPQERIAFLGNNGVGKSALLQTLLNIGDTQTLSGKIYADSHLKISYLSQQSNSYQGTLKQFAHHYNLDYSLLLSHLRKLGMTRQVFNTRIEHMSKGQQKRVALAKSLIEPANLYIWDEPLNYLDIDNQQQILNAIKKVNPTMLLVEHDQYFIKQIATNTFNLKH